MVIRSIITWLGVVLSTAVLSRGVAAQAEAAGVHIYFIAGEKSHAPGAHEFPAGAQLLADALNASGLPLRATVSLGWPQNSQEVEAAQVLVLYSDGLEKHVARDHVEILRHRFLQGKGLAVLHFALEADEEDGELQALMMEAIGGRFAVGWSVNPIWKLTAEPVASHPAAVGVEPIACEDEWYYHLKFREPRNGLKPLLQVIPSLRTLGADGPRSGNAAVRAALERGELQVVAWTKESDTGARGFGFTGGHFHRNWYDDSMRKLVLNALVWTAGIVLPLQGVVSAAPTAPIYATIDEAIARGDVDDVKRHLATDPARVNGSAEAKLKPLHQAILRRKGEIVTVLLAGGASATALDSSGRSPLHLAVERGDAVVVAELLKAKADPTVRDSRGWTPLHHAGAKNQLEIARLLLDGGTDPNILSELGGTPLHEAAVGGSVALVQLFLDRGTDLTIRSKPGVTALDIAREYKNTEVVIFLEKRVKK
ncbi:MAG TPA: ankyrin repeat domain-containing protein [Opitutaceae bacterium]|nr:ankyrin repeat domain-containing protein [Opitutaceae bacterium]